MNVTVVLNPELRDVVKAKTGNMSHHIEKLLLSNIEFSVSMKALTEMNLR